mmetsp:Transcript_43119/g.57049  ORF Transcript_43119/g.57049 Transcript_43119/m.57049 type:complete len:220 (-) Transcript_43119:1433-2092(-)
MCPLHVLVDERDRQDEVQVEGVHNVGDHAHSDGERGILEVRQRDIHRAELNAPSNVAVFGGWVFESQRIPIRRLQVLEVLIASDGRALEEPGGAQLGQLLVLLGQLGQRRVGSDLFALVGGAVITLLLFFAFVVFGARLDHLETLHDVSGRGLAAREDQLLFVDWDRASDEKRGDVVGETVVKTMLLQGLAHLRAQLAEVQIVVEVLHILVVANVATDC